MNNRLLAKGFTLIEVLIALAILSIALAALIRASAQQINNMGYLQNKMIAQWVATEVINEVRVGLLHPDNTENQTWMLNRNWLWQVNMSETPNPHIKKITVEVYAGSDQTRLIQLLSYMYVS